MIEFFNEDVKLPDIVQFDIIKGLNEVINLKGSIVGDINIIFCSDEYLLEVNKQYLNHDFYTDIITFDYCENNIVSGDIFISTDRVSDNSNLYCQSLLKELHRVIIHGILHLLGFNDKTDQEKERMTINEDKFLPYIFQE